MSDMKASVTLELIEKGFDKAERAAKSLDRLAKSGDKAVRTRNAGPWGDNRAARAAQRAVQTETRHAQAIDMSSRAMRRQRGELAALQREQERLARTQQRATLKANGGLGAGAALGAGARGLGGLGLSFLGGMGIGAGVGVGAAAAQTVRAAAADEFERDQLQVLGNISDAQMEVYRKTLEKSGARRGVGNAGAYGVFGGLMAGGLSDTDAAAMTDSVIVFAKATRASTEDAANSTVALRNQMGITADQMVSAYDAIALGGKAGQFEVEDMARSLPTLLARMKNIGETGEEGVRNTVAMAQAVRKATGTSAEAATALENMLAKFTAPDFIKNARKMGINIEKTMKDARKNGLSPVWAVLQKIQKVTKGDINRISEMLPDREAGLAVAAILGDMEEVQRLLKEMGNSGGTVMQDYATATDNASAAWDRFAANVATKAKSIATDALPAVTKALNAMSGVMESDGIETGAQSILNSRDHVYEKLFGLAPKPETYNLRLRDSYDEYQSSRNRGSAMDRRRARRDKREQAEAGGAVDYYPDLEKAMASSGRKAEAEAKQTAGSIENILQSMQTYAAGLKAGNQFAAGLRAAAPAAAAAANEVAGSVANHFPQSPAKTGPLRQLPAMGRKIASQLAGGMAHDSPARAATRVAARIAGEGRAAQAASARSRGRAGGPVNINVGGITISGVSDPREAADAAGHALRRRLDGVLGDVGAG